MVTGIYGVPVGFFCNIYGKGLYESQRNPKLLLTDCRENPMITIGFPCNLYILQGFLQPFSIDIAEKTYENPINPCKHLQCMYVLQDNKY